MGGRSQIRRTTPAVIGRATRIPCRPAPIRGKKRKSVFPIATAEPMEIGIPRTRREGAVRKLCLPLMWGEDFTALLRISGLAWTKPSHKYPEIAGTKIFVERFFN